MALGKSNFLVAIFVTCLAALPAHAFLPPPCPGSARPSTYRRNNEGGGGLEEIEFKIYPDGRVTEIVRGVKGKNCQEVTASINEKLGKVVDMQPTEEMFEEEMVVDQKLVQREGEGGGGWESASSW